MILMSRKWKTRRKANTYVSSSVKETYGIEIKYVTEIMSIDTITQIPEMPEYLKGIFNLRGKIIPVMDVRLRFDMEPCAYDDRTCIIVIDFKGVSTGLIVDSVSEVDKIDGDHIAELTIGGSGMNNKFIRTVGRIGDQVILLIDCETLLNVENVSESVLK